MANDRGVGPGAVTYAVIRLLPIVAVIDVDRVDVGPLLRRGGSPEHCNATANQQPKPTHFRNSSMSTHKDIGRQPPLARVFAEAHAGRDDARMEQAALV